MASEILLKKLRATLDKPDTVVLVGSGVSQWSGLPSWEKLVTDLADFVDATGGDGDVVRSEIADNDLLLAASYGVFQLKPQDFGRFMRDACKYGEAKPAEIHRKIATLGPSCFVTTNYDTLLEDAIRSDSAHGWPQVVTNRHTVEIADIILARATNFVFKYHGDGQYAESIILTRDQYRQLKGEYRNVIEALSTLLITRPVVMIGFGLRDPDFLSIKDTIITAFHGQVGEHYAIMADFDELKSRYWKENYAIEVISYPTYPTADGKGRDHRELLAVLDQVQTKQEVSEAPRPLSREERLIRFARLASRLIQLRPEAVIELPLTTTPVQPKEKRDFLGLPYVSAVEKLLENFGQSFVLVGQPGAGKSFSMKRYAALLANCLKEVCFTDEPPAESDMHIALFGDLKLYEGDIRKLLSEQLPEGLELGDVTALGQCTVLLDSANEMPREYVESGGWERDVKEFMNEASNCRVIIGSRPQDWLDGLDLPQFSIDNIKADFVVDYLKEHTSRNLRAEPALLHTLTTPLFFNMAALRMLDLDEVRVPRDIYKAFFNSLGLSWAEETGHTINFVELFAPVAFQMIERGQEHMSLDAFGTAVSSIHGADLDAAQLIDFLVAERVLFVMPGRRLMFFHQSATEYSAAVALAEKYHADKSILDYCIRDKRWDQALFLAMSLMPADDASAFFEKLLRTDVVCAMRATQFIEENRRQIITKILNFLLHATELFSNDLDYYFQVTHAFDGLPVEKEHTTLLEALVEVKNLLGGVAIGHLVRLHPDQRRAVIDTVLDNLDDYNFVSRAVSELRKSIVEDDVRYVLEAISTKSTNEDSYKDLIGTLLLSLSDADRERVIGDYLDQNKIVNELITQSLTNLESDFTRRTLAHLVKKNVKGAIFRYFLSMKHLPKEVLSTKFAVDNELGKVLINKIVEGEEQATYASGVLHNLARSNPQWADFIRKYAKDLSPGQSVPLNVLAAAGMPEQWQILKVFIDGVTDATPDEVLNAVGNLDIWEDADWDLILSAIVTRRIALADPVLDDLRTSLRLSLGPRPALCPLRPLEWWLEWLSEYVGSTQDKDRWGKDRWFAYKLGEILAYGDNTTSDTILSEFNRVHTQSFELLGRFVIGKMDNVSTDDLSPDAIAKLLEFSLNLQAVGPLDSPLLGTLATERFVEEKLLPLIQNSVEVTEEARSHIEKVLHNAGRRHNKRYVAPSKLIEERTPESAN